MPSSSGPSAASRPVRLRHHRLRQRAGRLSRRHRQAAAAEHGRGDPWPAAGERQRAATQAELRVERFTTEAHEVIESPDVDLVIILTSMRRARASRRARPSRPGKHVLVEKPLATTLDGGGRRSSSWRRRSRGHPRLRPVHRAEPDLPGDRPPHPRAATSARSARRARATAGPAPGGASGSTEPGGGCLFDLGVLQPHHARPAASARRSASRP